MSKKAMELLSYIKKYIVLPWYHVQS